MKIKEAFSQIVFSISIFFLFRGCFRAFNKNTYFNKIICEKAYLNFFINGYRFRKFTKLLCYTDFLLDIST